LSIAALACFQRQAAGTENRSLEEIQRDPGPPGGALRDRDAGLTAARNRARGPATPFAGGSPPGKVS
jgi:hypothetical protein